MKKITSVLLTVVMLASMLSVTAAAAPVSAYVEANARVDNASRTVTVVFTAVQPTTNGRIAVEYDAGSLTYVDCSVSGTASSVSQSAGTVTFGYGTSTAGAIQSGETVAVLTLSVNAGATGTTNLAVTVKEFNNEGLGTGASLPQIGIDLGTAGTDPAFPAPNPGGSPSQPVSPTQPVGPSQPGPGTTEPEPEPEPDGSQEPGPVEDVTPPPATVDPAETFDDVSAGQWFYPAVSYVVNEGYFQGTSANEFSPDSAMTRAMFVTVLGRMAGIDENANVSTGFTDVNVGAWYAAAVAWASGENIVMGTSETTFGPNGNVTREQMVVFLYRFARYLGLDVSFDASVLSQYGDSAAVSAWAADAMAWAIGHGIISGTGTGLEPQAFATRAQVAQIILSFSKLM